MEDGSTRQRTDRARDGDVEALGELFEALRPDVLRLCTRLVGAVDAEDAASEAFGRAQRRLESYDARRPFRRWLLSIAANHCVDRLRRRSLEKRLFEAHGDESDVEALASAAGSALDGVVRAEEQLRVQDAVDRLPDRYRAPVVLRYFAELGYDEIAEELGVERSQVASLLYRGKQHLRASLARERGGPA